MGFFLRLSIYNMGECELENDVSSEAFGDAEHLLAEIARMIRDFLGIVMTLT